MKEKELDKKEITEEKTNEICEKCQNAMIIKLGRFGKFLACSNYPDCKTTQNINKSLGVKCPQCQKGNIVEKRTRAGKIFYACDTYPDCEHALWSKPTGDYCPECKQLLLHATQDKIKCENCNFTK